MARFFTLSSSSKGNCTFIHGGDTSVLVDAGISFKQIRQQLESRDCSVEDIDGILITHEHSDHIRGLKVMLKHHNIPVYGNVRTLSYLAQNNLVGADANLVAVEEEFEVKNIKINPFSTPHDAVDSVGYRLEINGGVKIGVATDLGHITDSVHDHLQGCDLVMIESNYDEGMLQCSRYPYMLKMRIGGSRGHLENQECAKEVVSLIQRGTSRFVLGHLSEENNMPRLAFETLKSFLLLEGMELGKDYLLDVAPARTAGNMVTL